MSTGLDALYIEYIYILLSMHFQYESFKIINNSLIYINKIHNTKSITKYKDIIFDRHFYIDSEIKNYVILHDPFVCLVTNDS